ncbi:MAG: hypothetical protein H7Y89_11110 [Steroidobacteraceae bacterium]|nr:hypothetical protein [Steroidobacteraceae bacterium]
MLKCSYCKQSAMSFARKCVLSPDESTPCGSCGKTVGVQWAAVGAAIPVALGIIAALRFPLPWNVLGGVSGVIAYGALQRWVVPLVGREG